MLRISSSEEHAVLSSRLEGHQGALDQLELCFDWMNEQSNKAAGAGMAAAAGGLMEQLQQMQQQQQAQYNSIGTVEEMKATNKQISDQLDAAKQQIGDLETSGELTGAMLVQKESRLVELAREHRSVTEALELLELNKDSMTGQLAACSA